MRNHPPVIGRQIAESKGLPIPTDKGFFETKENDDGQQNAAPDKKVKDRAPTDPTRDQAAQSGSDNRR